MTGWQTSQDEKSLPQWTGMGKLRRYKPTGIPPPFCEVVVKDHPQAVDLAYEETPVSSITVARQHRTRTGFAIMPSHPGKRHLRTNIEFQAFYAR
jgi:hypothetical protein